MSTIHNPSNFDPADYEVEDYLDNRRPQYYGQGIEAHKQEVEFWQADMARTFGPDWIKKIHHCSHCGNGRVRWITAVRHKPTNEVCVFGSDCTRRLEFVDKQQFKLAQLQSRDEARKVRLKIWKAREAYLAANPAIGEALVAIDANRPEHAKNAFVRDVLRKLDQYGSLSDKQRDAVVSSLQRDRDYAARQAAAVPEVKGDAPSGRVEVTGVVVSTKEQESQFGWVTKMLVKFPNGSKGWVTAPSKETIDKGDTLTFVATWTVSKDDKSFAFGSRPHLITRVAAVAGQAAQEVR